MIEVSFDFAPPTAQREGLTAQRSTASGASRMLQTGILIARGLAAATFCWAARRVLRIAMLPSFVRARTMPPRRLASHGVSLDRSRRHSATLACVFRGPLLRH